MARGDGGDTMRRGHEITAGYLMNAAHNAAFASALAGKSFPKHAENRLVISRE
jgi:hypothetical protein